jgi:hypothetical protein
MKLSKEDRRALIAFLKTLWLFRSEAGSPVCQSCSQLADVHQLASRDPVVKLTENAFCFLAERGWRQKLAIIAVIVRLTPPRESRYLAVERSKVN